MSAKGAFAKRFIAKLLPPLSLLLFPAIKPLLCLSVSPRHLLWMEKEKLYVYARTQKQPTTQILQPFVIPFM